jgi:hypothetical protein
MMVLRLVLIPKKKEQGHIHEKALKVPDIKIAMGANTGFGICLYADY